MPAAGPARRQSTGSWSASKRGSTITFRHVNDSNAIAGTRLKNARAVSSGDMSAGNPTSPKGKGPVESVEIASPTPAPRRQVAAMGSSRGLNKGRAFSSVGASRVGSPSRSQQNKSSPGTSGLAMVTNVVTAQNHVMAQFVPAEPQSVPESPLIHDPLGNSQMLARSTGRALMPRPELEAPPLTRPSFLCPSIDPNLRIRQLPDLVRHRKEGWKQEPCKRKEPIQRERSRRRGRLRYSSHSSLDRNPV